MRTVIKNSDFKNKLPQSVVDIADLFNKNGLQLFVVGGSIRDFLLGKEPKDFDVCTNAPSKDVVKLLKNSGYKAKIHGESFEVAVVYTEDCPMGIEIATFRKDVYDESTLGITRNCAIELATFEEDCERRDLTINAFYYDIHNESIIDPHNGMEDLANKIIRMVGNAKDRLTEDKLRALRALRFATKTGFEIEAKTMVAIRKCNLDNISMERVWSKARKSTAKNEKDGEIINAFKSGNTQLLSELLIQSKMIKHIFNGESIKNPSPIDTKFLTSFINNYIPHKDGKFMVDVLKIDSKTAKKIEILRLVKNFTVNNLITVKRKLTQNEISKEEVVDFTQNPQLVDKLFNFKLMSSVEIDELIKEGYEQAALGSKIFSIEVEKFTSIS